MSDGDKGKVIELRPLSHEWRDVGKTATVVGFGEVLEFRQPPTRTIEEVPEQRVFEQKKRRWKWDAAEDDVGFSMRHDKTGEHVVFAFENPGESTVYEVWLPTAMVGERGGDFPASVVRRLYPVLNSARETADEVRRREGVEEVVGEVVGVGGTWRLVHGILPRGNDRRDEEWWKVVGGAKAPRIYAGGFDSEKQARRDFARHRPPWGCGAHPRSQTINVGGKPPESWEALARHWYRASENEPCRRKSAHKGEHRNRAGVEWSTWPVAMRAATEIR